MTAPEVQYMDTETFENIPQPRNLPMYEDNSEEALQLRYERTRRRLEYLRDAIHGYDSTQGRFQ
jgi:hypothetical protein